jgi:hypothetical protein
MENVMVDATTQPELLPLHSTARQARVPVEWLRKEAEAGRVPCLRVGRRLMFNVAAVTRALTERAATERLNPETARP